MEMMGQKINGTDIKMAPNKRYTEMKMGEMTVFQTVFDGTKGFQAQMGQKKEMDEKEIKESQDEKALIPQLFYLTNEYQISYMGMEKTGGEDAYKLKITKPSGKVSIEYYAAKTGLLVKEESTTDAGGSEMTVTIDFTNYKKVGNVLLPFSVTQTAGEQEIQMNIDEIKMNEGVTEADFNK